MLKTKEEIVSDWLPRYTGSKVEEFGKYIILVNFQEYVNRFAAKFGVEVKYFRPPHGRFNLYTNKILKERGMVNVMWSLLTYDFKGDISKVKMSVSWCIQNNSIIVLHDNLKSEKIISESIDYIAREAAGKGITVAVWKKFANLWFAIEMKQF